jgi:hypothetical protein
MFVCLAIVSMKDEAACETGHPIAEIDHQLRQGLETGNRLLDPRATGFELIASLLRQKPRLVGRAGDIGLIRQQFRHYVLEPVELGEMLCNAPRDAFDVTGSVGAPD